MVHFAAALGLLLSLCTTRADATPPVAPTMNVAVAGQRVSISWTEVAGATSYVLYYAPYPNADSIYQADMGTSTSLTVDLPLGAAYYAAVRARNADGESGYSNLGTVIIPTAAGMTLQSGDYWEFEWSDTTASTTSSGTGSTGKTGSFRVTLSAPQNLAGRTAYPITVSGDAGVGKPVWNYLTTDGPLLLGTRDGTAYSTILGSETGGWKGAGFFSFFRPDLSKVVSKGTFQGNYRTVGAWVVSRSSSSGGCTYYSEVGENICATDPSSYSESEYEKAGVGPVGYRYSSSTSFSGGGFYQVVNITRLVELVKSSKVADDGTAFTGTPWTRLSNITRGAYINGAAAFNGKVYAFGGWWTGGGGPPWVQIFDPASGTWNTSASAGAEVSAVIGMSGGVLYGVGRTSSTGAMSLLRLDTTADRNQWTVVAGTAPSFSNPCGAGVLANGYLAVVDCPGVSSLTVWLYGASRSGARKSWAGVSLDYRTILRPGIAVVGDDVYAIGGYENSGFSRGISSAIYRYRSSSAQWEALSVGMRTARDGPVAVAIGTKIYVMGGAPASSSSASDRLIEVFDTITQTWGSAPALPESRSRFAAAALNGSIYLIGGLSSNVWLTSAVRYTP